jgi:hypothetical protein
MFPQHLRLYFNEIIFGQEVMGDKAASRRKTPPLFGPSILEENITIPAIEEDIPGSGKSTGGPPEVYRHPFPGM